MNGLQSPIDIQNVNTWSSHCSDWLNWLHAGAVSQQTVSLRRYQMGRFATDHAHRSPWQLEPADLAKWLASHEWSPETLRSYRAAIRSFYGWAHASGLTSSDPSRLLRRVTTPPPKPRPAPESVVTGALHCADARAWLMLMLGSRHGLRRGEIAKVHTDDVRDSPDGVGYDLLVHGKGNKLRTVPLLDEVALVIRKCSNGWVFPNGKGTHLTAAHVGVLLRRLLASGVTPHQLRHRFASKAYQATHDIRAVQELLGHASVATTQRYVAVADDALRRAVHSAA